MADMRKCIGSAKFGIEAHEAPRRRLPDPAQPEGRAGPDVQAPLEPVHERAAEGGAGPQGRRGRSGHRGGADRVGTGRGRGPQGSRRPEGRPRRPGRRSPSRSGRGRRADARADGEPIVERRAAIARGRPRATPRHRVDAPAAEPRAPGRKPGARSRGVAPVAVRSVIAARGRPVAPVGERGRGSAPGISRETRPRAHIWEARSSRSAEPACGYPRSASDAPLVELHDRQSTAQLPMSNGAPPAASGTT